MNLVAEMADNLWGIGKFKRNHTIENCTYNRGTGKGLTIDKVASIINSQSKETQMLETANRNQAS